MNSLNREPYLSDLTDAQWQRIEPLLPKPVRTGRRRANDREVINGILYVLVTGCSWEYLPHDIGTS
jgi:putative transposase